MFEKSVYILLAIWSHAQITECWNPCLSKCTNVQEVIVWMRCVWGSHGRGEGTFISHSSGSETNTAAHTNLQKPFFSHLLIFLPGDIAPDCHSVHHFWYQRQGHLVEKSDAGEERGKAKSRQRDGTLKYFGTL